MEKEHSNLPIENSKKDELKPASLVRYESMSNELLELYKRKNADYGDSITNSLNLYKIAFPSYLLRIKEKIERCLVLQEHEAQVQDEKVLDTIKDIANYAIILAAWLENATCPYIRKERNELDDPSKQIGTYDTRKSI